MKRNIIKLIYKLLSLLGSFIGVLFLAVINGTVGFLLAISITVFAAIAILKLMGITIGISYTVIAIIITSCGILRGLIRYVEQYSNHYIAFKILAIIRDKLFRALRKLSPAKLDDKNKGELISILQSDIETLEVFYAHTVSPFLIALLTSTVMVIFISLMTSIHLGLSALLSYILIGVIIPVIYYNLNKKYGRSYRQKLGEFEGYYLDSIYGGYEILSQNKNVERSQSVDNSSKALIKMNKAIEDKGSLFKNITNALIVILNLLIVIVGGILIEKGLINEYKIILAYVALTSSFGSVVALANLPGNLTMSFASGNRVLDILEEEAIVKEGNDINEFAFEEVELKNVSFGYDDELILKDINLKLKKGEIIGIVGASGSGKTTILKLLMHFYYVRTGEILYNNINVNKISHKALYDNVNLFSQTTYLFSDTILNNLLIAKPNASMDEVIEACKNASIYDYIMKLENKFETKITDLKDNLSSGEKQRLGLARVFLNKPKLLLLDEATSNIDAINEGIILNAINKYKKDMAVLIVSHRLSTLSICQRIYEFKENTLCQNIK